MKHHSSALIVPASVVAMLVSGPVLSQVLDEIIVTAQKREESLQQVPVAVSAFSQDYLNKIGAYNIERLDALTPGLEWGQHGHGAKISIRGMSVANSEANSDSPVGFFVDGIYLGRGQQFWAVMSDVERVEVLRGPQGTLFGRNTSGGSINLISRKPGRETAGKIEVTAGDYNHVGVSGFFNAPMGENWAGRLTFYSEDHDGYLENTFETDQDQMDEDLWSVRGALRYDSGPLVVDIALERWEQGGNGNAFSGAKYFSPILPGLNFWATILSGQDIPENSATPWQIHGNRSYRDKESTNGTLTISYDFANTTFKSITGFSDYVGTDGGETDFSELFLFDCRLFTDVQTFSQEFQLSSNTNENLQWVAGLYYLDEDQFEEFAIAVFDTPIPTGDVYNRLGTATAEALAIYGQGTYSISEKTRLTIGARYTTEDKTYTNLDGSGREIPPSAETFDETTWKIGLDYRIDDSRMVYGHISTGFKAGGFNRYIALPPGMGVQYPVVFKPETLTNYAIGFKGDLIGDTLRLNAEVYYNQIDDFQSYAFDNSIPTSITANAEDSETKGAELELTWLPSEPAQINVILAYMDAYYGSYTGYTDGFLTIDASGNKRALSPEWKFTLAGSYDFDLGSRGTLTPYVQFTYKDDYFVTPANDTVNGYDQQDSYTQTDIRLVWNSLEGSWRGELFLTNIEDNFVKTGGYLATGGWWITYGPEPTVFGARLSYSY